MGFNGKELRPALVRRRLWQSAVVLSKSPRLESYADTSAILSPTYVVIGISQPFAP